MSSRKLQNYMRARREWLNGALDGSYEPVILSKKKRAQREWRQHSLETRLTQIFNSIVIFGLLSAFIFHMLQASL